MKHKIIVTYLLSIIAIMSGCGGSDGGATANGIASFFNGATPTNSSSGKSMIHDLSVKRVSLAAVTPGDGNWLLSPDKMILTLTSIGLITSSGSSSGTLTNSSCTITYDRSQVGLAKLVDCPFTVSPGTYTSMNVNFNATYQVLINDSTNGFFTTSSGIITTTPAGGAQNYTVKTTSSGSTFGNTSYFSSPLTIATGGTVTLNIVISGLQFFHANVSSGTVGLGWPSTNYANDPFRPDMTASVTSLASLGFYVTPKIGTALSYNSTSAGASGITSVSTYYSSASTPTFLVMGLNGTPTGCSPIGVAGVINGPPNHNTLGGYLGLDSNSVLGWAVPTDNTWSTYSAEFNMSKLTTLGQKTTLNCKQISTDPAPSGNTFASGAPNITSPSYSTDMVLVAQ